MFKRVAGSNETKPSTEAKQDERESPQQHIRTEVISTLKEIYDPEIPVNIYDLGLIYKLDIDPRGHVLIRMTLTTPACPVAQSFPEIVANRVRMVPGVEDVTVELVWDPPWSQERISEAAKLQMGLL